MGKELAPWALWATPILITVIGVLIGMMVRYFLMHMTASMSRIEGRIDALCREMRDDYVTKDACTARHACQNKCGK